MPTDEKQMWPQTSRRPLILALSGGGFRGYFTIQILSHLETVLGRPCHKIFDLIAGTSVGGIIALGLANGVAARAIQQKLNEKAEVIFPDLWFRKVRRARKPPYSSAGIVSAMNELLPDRYLDPMKKSLQRVLVVAANPTTAQMVVISSWDLHRTGEISIVDAARATSAAPTYFPAHRTQFGPHRGASMVELVDGGIAANAPDAVAIHHAVHTLGFPADQIAMCSIGTCGQAEGGPSGERPAAPGMAGVLMNLGGSGIVNLIMAIQESRGVAEARDRLGAQRYWRIDRTPSTEQAKQLRLDNATQSARNTLENLAHQAIEELDKTNHNVLTLMLARAQAN